MVQLLFLAAAGIGARGRRSCWPFTAMFLAGPNRIGAGDAHTGWTPAPRFVEAAAALAIAYLAVEILLLPNAGARWLIAAVLGGFPRLYFHLFLQTTGYPPSFVLAGAARRRSSPSQSWHWCFRA